MFRGLREKLFPVKRRGERHTQQTEVLIFLRNVGLQLEHIQHLPNLTLSTEAEVVIPLPNLDRVSVKSACFFGIRVSDKEIIVKIREPFVMDGTTLSSLFRSQADIEEIQEMIITYKKMIIFAIQNDIEKSEDWASFLQE